MTEDGSGTAEDKDELVTVARATEDIAGLSRAITGNSIGAGGDMKEIGSIEIGPDGEGVVIACNSSILCSKNSKSGMITR